MNLVNGLILTRALDIQAAKQQSRLIGIVVQDLIGNLVGNRFCSATIAGSIKPMRIRPERVLAFLDSRRTVRNPIVRQSPAKGDGRGIIERKNANQPSPVPARLPGVFRAAARAEPVE